MLLGEPPRGGLRRPSLPRTPVNRGKKKGRGTTPRLPLHCHPEGGPSFGSADPPYDGTHLIPVERPHRGAADVPRLDHL